MMDSSLSKRIALRKKCPYSELFWSAFSRIRTEYGEILRISPYSVRMRVIADQNNSEYRHFSRSVDKYDSDIFGQAVEVTYQQELLKFPRYKAFSSEVIG